MSDFEQDFRPLLQSKFETEKPTVLQTIMVANWNAINMLCAGIINTYDNDVCVDALLRPLVEVVVKVMAFKIKPNLAKKDFKGKRLPNLNKLCKVVWKGYKDEKHPFFVEYIETAHELVHMNSKTIISRWHTSTDEKISYTGSSEQDKLDTKIKAIVLWCLASRVVFKECGATDCLNILNSFLDTHMDKV